MKKTKWWRSDTACSGVGSTVKRNISLTLHNVSGANARARVLSVLKKTSCARSFKVYS